MKKLFLIVSVISLFFTSAYADPPGEPFPAFVTGQGAAGSITGTELAPLIQGGATVKATLSVLKTYFQAGGGGGTGTVTSVGTTAPLSGGPITGAGTLTLTGPSNLTSFTATAIPKGNGSFPFVASSLTDDGTTVLTTEQLSVGGVKAADQAGSGVRCIHVDNTGKQSVASGDCATGGSGSVTSIGISVPATSIFGVTGSPVTTSGTIGITTTGTSGGIPYFSSSSQLATSAALSANLPVIGGGGGAAPSTGTRSGNTTAFVTTTGAQTAGNAVTIDANGNHIASGAVLPVAANPTATIGTSAINGSAATFMRSDASPPIPLCSASTAGACKPDGTTITASAGVLTAVGSGGIPNTTILSPIAGDNAPQLTTALSTYNTVILSPGFYRVCSQVEVPGHRTLKGTDDVKQGIGTLNPSFHGATQIGTSGCSGSPPGTFTSGQGFFHLHDGTTLTGFTITGNWWLDNTSTLNCVNAKNAMSIAIFGMQIDGCNIALDRRSTAVSGDSGSISQDAVISHNTFNYHLTGILCGSDGGGNGCADERYIDNEFEVTGTNIRCDQCNNSQYLGNRIEDGGLAFYINGGSGLLINNNLMNRISIIMFDGATAQKNYEIEFVGNRSSGTEPGNVDHGIRFLGPNQLLTITNNSIPFNYNFAFEVDPAALIFNSNINTNNIKVPLFDSNHAASQVVHNSPSVPVALVSDSQDAAMETWTTVNSTKAAFASSGPTGDPLAARITEGSAGAGSVQHYITVSGYVPSTGNTYTAVAYFHPGSSGTRNIGISMGSTNSFEAIFNPSTCAFVGSTVTGSGVIVGTPSAISLGGGWCLGSVTFTGLGASSAYLELASGSSSTYTGDGTSNALVFSFDMINGAIAPSTWIIRPL